MKIEGMERELDIKIGEIIKILLGKIGEILIEDEEDVKLGEIIELEGMEVKKDLRGWNEKVGKNIEGIKEENLRIWKKIEEKNEIVEDKRNRKINKGIERKF